MMPKSRSISIVAAALLIFGSASAAEKPNIVYILADDMGYGDPGCYNLGSKIPTPHMDRFAREGMRFTDAHSPSAVCTPTRYGILTGRYCWRTPLKKGVLLGYSPVLIEKDRLTLASLLKQHGYATACIGKWHLGLGAAGTTDYFKPLSPAPRDFGFDYFFGIPASLDMEPYVFVENDRAVQAPTQTIEASKATREEGRGWFWRAGPAAPGFRHIDVLPKLTKKAVGFIEKQTPGKPFFLYLPLTGPHTPWVPTDEFVGKSGAGACGDFVAQVDWTIGQVLAALDRAKLADDTLVVVTSDNGSYWLPAEVERYGHRANGPWRGQKSDIHEGGHRIPFIVRWPGRVKPGTISDQTLCLTDAMATVAEILGTKLPDNAGEDSVSILPTLRGEKPDKPLREAVVLHSGNGTFAVRAGEWKLVEDELGSGGFTPPAKRAPKAGEPAGQLYNLATDPGEQKNAYADNPAVVARLAGLLKKYRESGRSRP